MAPRRALATVALVTVLALVAGSCSRDGGSDGAAPSTTTTEDLGESTATTGPLGSGPSPIKDGIRIEVLSSQPDRVSGNDARIRVSPVSGARAEDLVVKRDGVDVTRSLQVVDGSLEGVVDGFIEGNNTLTAKAGKDEALQRVRAWPLTGPIISGPHLPLLACSTEEYGLGRPLDADCSAAPKVTWRYIDAKGALRDLPDGPGSKPADLGTAKIDGKDVPLLVRYEQGVINRSIYEIASLGADPGGPGWNRQVLYRYGGGGCGTTYGQGASLTTAADPAFLKQGFVVATATFNTAAVQCNDVLSAETTMMVKERIIEQFGSPDFTIGEGEADGASLVHLMAQNYPGLVNGIVASSPFPDVVSVASGATDCGLLTHYYGTAKGKTLTDAQRTAINGHLTSKTCAAWAESFVGILDPTDGCDPKIDRAKIYSASNPSGVRCTYWDANRNQYGIDPDRGWGLRPLDNIGLQYGLLALNAGTITVDQFLDVNASIGGYDPDGKVMSDRERSDPVAIYTAYETGRVSMGGGDQGEIPIIDINVFRDREGDIHDQLRAFSLRDRLEFDGGTSPGFQIWTRDPSRASGAAAEAVSVMAKWLTALSKDTEGGPMDTVLQRTRPEAAVDNCLTKDATKPEGGVGIYEKSGPCKDQFPISGDPRIGAGGRRANEALKCELKAIDPSDYEVPFTTTQSERLQEIFPEGVCDWSGPAVGETIPANPDRSYEDADNPSRDA